MLAGSLPLDPTCELVLCFSICHTCCYGVSLSAMPAGVMPHYRPYLLMRCLNISPSVLVWFLNIGNAFWCGASLQAMPSGFVTHYQPCLLVCCFPIGHAFWRDASLSTMPIGVVPHHIPYLLAWYLTIGHVFWSIATAIKILLAKCRWKKGGNKSGATYTEVPLYQTCLMIRCHSQICLLVQCNYYQTCMLGS